MSTAINLFIYSVKKQRQLKTLEDLTIRDDYMFSKVMSFQKICKEFLEAIFWKKLAP